jgi:uncharacterized protein involved in exopolysaccharide biosynthesis
VPTEEKLVVAASLPVILLPLMRAAVRWKRLIWITALALAAGASITAFLLPDLYTATVVLLPPGQNNSAGAALLSQLGSLGAMASLGAGGLGIKNPNEMQVSLLRSRTVEDAIAERFHLQQIYRRPSLSQVRRRWEKQTAVDNGLKDGLIRISVTDRDPNRAAEFANGWLEEYRRLTASLAIDEAAQRRLFFERQLNAAQDDLAHAEEELKATEQRTGVIEMEGQARAMIESAATLRAQLAAKQVEIQAMRQFAAEQNPDLERAEQESASLAAQLAATDVEREHREGDLVDPRGSMTQNGLDYARALREMKYRETMVQLLARQYEVARVDEARQGSLIQVVDAATVPDRPSSRYRLWIFLCGLLAAIPLGLTAALAAEFRSILLHERSRSGSWAGVLEAFSAGGAR